MRGIPTKYRGIWFRSLAEARWAAFFDLMGWRWQYEPQELPGWIPDFALLSYREDAPYIYVEVKPRRQFREAINKAKNSGVLEPVLIVSADGPDGFHKKEGRYFLGLVLHRGRKERASVTLCCKGDFHFCNPANQMSHHLCDRFKQPTVISDGYGEIRKRWAESQNRTKWPPRTQRTTPMPLFPHCWTIDTSEIACDDSIPKRLPILKWILGTASVIAVAVLLLVLFWDTGVDECQVVAESTSRGGANASEFGGGALVQRIVDGDDIVLGSNERVRYIGVDTPERGDRYFVEASEYNRRLVEGKQVRLEKDISETDRYDRLLRYVHIGEVMVNAELVREGWAEAKMYQPDVKYAECFEELQNEARQARRGIWAN